MDRYREWLNLPFVFSRQVWFFVPKLARMLFFDDFLILSISRVPSKSNGYLENVGGYYNILIGTLNPPNDPPDSKRVRFCQPLAAL